MQRLYVQGEPGAGLFLDPGLGKTLITLLLLQRLIDLGEIEHALIVAPLRVCRLVWPAEIKKWGFNIDHNVLCKKLGYTTTRKFDHKKNKMVTVRTGRKPMPKQRTIEIINPESLHHLEDEAHRWDIIIVDESTMFKNWTCKRMKAMRKLCVKVSKRLILTGTPAPNSLADLHGQLFILDGGEALGRNVTVFRSLYMHQGGWQGRQWMLKENQGQKIHDRVAPLCLRLDAETCLDMPDKVINDVLCELPAACVPQYKQLQRDLLAQLETADILAMNQASAYSKTRQFANGQMYDTEKVAHFVHKAKLEALQEVVGELNGKPVLVFYQFDHDREAILKVYKKAPVLKGGVSEADGERICNEWNAGLHHVFLIQNQAGSHGLNLQECGNDVIYYGLGDRPEVYDQSYKRIYRQGVKGSEVRIHRLLMLNTVDMLIRDRLELKDQSQQEFCEALKNHAREGLT